MKITPATFAVPRSHSNATYAQVSFYKNCVRFNKVATQLLDLPRPMAFDFDSMQIIPDRQGFPMKLNRYGDCVINSRPLTAKATGMYELDRVTMRITKADDGFNLSLDDTPFRHSGAVEEMENMMRVG